MGCPPGHNLKIVEIVFCFFEGHNDSPKLLVSKKIGNSLPKFPEFPTAQISFLGNLWDFLYQNNFMVMKSMKVKNSGLVSCESMQQRINSITYNQFMKFKVLQKG